MRLRRPYVSFLLVAQRIKTPLQMQSQVTSRGRCPSASAARWGPGPGTGTPGCSPRFPSAPHRPRRHPDDSPWPWVLSRCGSPPVPVWVTAWPWQWRPAEALMVPHGSRQRESLIRGPRGPRPPSPACGTRLCRLPAGPGTSSTVPEIPRPLTASLRGCLTRPCRPVPSAGSGLPHQPPCDRSHHAGGFSGSARPAPPPGRAPSFAINARQLFLDGLPMPRALQQRHQMQ